MAVPFFEKFPIIGFDMFNTGEKTIAVNILNRIKIQDALLNSHLIFYTYTIKDGETHEMIADKLYGDSGYDWIILLANNIVDPYFDWPLSYEDMIKTIRKKYNTPLQDGLIFAYQTIHHYEDKNGVVIDETTYRSLPAVERTAVSVYDYEMNANEAKRQIRLLDPSFVDQVDAEADTILKS
jgi:hypothetical protein